MIFDYFSVSAFSFNHGFYILPEIIYLNVNHHCPTRCLPLLILCVHLFTWPDAIDIANNNSFIFFGNSRIVLDPISYTPPPPKEPYEAVYYMVSSPHRSRPASSIKNYVVNKTFTNLIKFETIITSFPSPVLSCCIIAQLLNIFSLYPALKIYLHSNFIALL